jgi:transposase
MHPLIGIDIAKHSFDVALPLDKPGKFRTKAKLPNSPVGFHQLRTWIAEHAPGTAVCMEATGVYHEALATFLHEQGLTVFVVNPAQVAFFAKSELLRVKTDRSDAKLIARFATQQQHLQPMRPWTPPTPVQRKLRALFFRLEDLQAMEQMELNRRDVADASVIASIEDHLRTLKEQIATLKKQIDDHIDSDPDLRRDRSLLKTIPGLGDKVSATFLACVGDLRRFERPNQLDAFAGLNPAIRQSGESQGYSRISKWGNPTLRAKLYMAAIVAKTHNPVISRFVQRLRDHGKSPMVALIAAMRKLLHIAWGVVRSGQPFDPHLALA